MAIFTPRGLKVRLPVRYAFALIARLYPHADAFRVLQLTEAVENLGRLATLISGIIVFSIRLEPIHIALAAFVAVSLMRIVHLLGLFVLPFTLLIPISRIYGLLCGYGVLFVGLVVFGVITVGWRGVGGFFVGRVAAGILCGLAELIYQKHLYRKTGIAITSSERSFFHAYRLEAARLGASTDLATTESELASTNWGSVFADLAVKWPEVVSRFTDDDDSVGGWSAPKLPT